MTEDEQREILARHMQALQSTVDRKMKTELCAEFAKYLIQSDPGFRGDDTETDQDD